MYHFVTLKVAIQHTQDLKGSKLLIENRSFNEKKLLRKSTRCQIILAQSSVASRNPFGFFGSLLPVSHHSPMVSLLYFVSLNAPRFAFYSLAVKPAFCPAANSNKLLNSFSRRQKKEHIPLFSILSNSYKNTLFVQIFWNGLFSTREYILIWHLFLFKCK